MCLNLKYVYCRKDSKGKLIPDFSHVFYKLPEGSYPSDLLLLPLKCGKCIECCVQHTDEWTVRMLDEARKYVDSCFLTLTYKDNPVDLKPVDLTNFLKRLRKAIEPIKIRYYACGEYGSKRSRPHYHLIVYNYFPSDAEFFFYDEKKNPIYQSKFISDVWQKGFITVGRVSADSCKYTTKYLQKMVDYTGKVPPFTRMSLKPGLGFYSVDSSALETGYVYVDGYRKSIPRYYLKVLEKQGVDLSEYKTKRNKSIVLIEKSVKDK